MAEAELSRFTLLVEDPGYLVNYQMVVASEGVSRWDGEDRFGEGATQAGCSEERHE